MSNENNGNNGDNGRIGRISIEEKEMSLEDFEISHEGPSVFVNNFYLAVGHWGIKIAFAEQLRKDIPPVFRSAVVMSKQEATALQIALQKLLNNEAGECFKLISVKSNNEPHNNEDDPINK